MIEEISNNQSNKASKVSQKTKILYLITKSNWGGAQKYVYDLATELKDKYEIKVALGGDGPLASKLRQANIPVIGINGLGRDISFKNDLFALIDIISIIWTERPDILHVNSSKISGLGSFIGRIFGIKKIIFTAHGWAFNENRSVLSKYLIKIAYLLTIWFSHITIGVSNQVIKQISDWPINKRKLHVIKNGIHTPNFLPRVEARKYLSHTTPEIFKSIADLEPDLNNEVIWFGGIGELHPIKGHVYAIQAMANISAARPNLKFIYMIIGEGDIRSFLTDEIKRLGLESKVFLLGLAPDAAIYLKAFDYYIFPSLSEGLAYAVIEAGFANLPVIASQVGGIPEIITSSVHGTLVPSMNPVAIEHAIYTYIDHPEIAIKHASALNEKVEKEFAVRDMVEKTSSIYLSGGNSK